MNIFTCQGSQQERSELMGSGTLTTALCCFQELTAFGLKRCSAMKNMDFLAKLMLWAVQLVDTGGDQVREAGAGAGVWEKQNLQVQGEKPAGRAVSRIYPQGLCNLIYPLCGALQACSHQAQPALTQLSD